MHPRPQCAPRRPHTSRPSSARQPPPLLALVSATPGPYPRAPTSPTCPLIMDASHFLHISHHCTLIVHTPALSHTVSRHPGPCSPFLAAPTCPAQLLPRRHPAQPSLYAIRPTSDTPSHSALLGAKPTAPHRGASPFLHAQTRPHHASVLPTCPGPFAPGPIHMPGHFPLHLFIPPVPQPCPSIWPSHFVQAVPPGFACPSKCAPRLLPFHTQAPAIVRTIPRPFPVIMSSSRPARSHILSHPALVPIRFYYSVRHCAVSIGFQHAHPQICMGFVRWGVISFSFFLHQSLLGSG